MSPHEMQRAGNRVGVDDGMRSIVVRKRASNEDWLPPKPIPSDLARVEAFALELLPDRLAPWIDDIATRLQCPPDYPAITAMTALGAILGRKIAIKPQMKTDWIEIPNIWGAFIGPPGMLKSPAMNEALRPIHRLEAEAVRNNEIAQQAYSAGLDAFRLRKQVAAALAKEELKKTIKGESSGPEDFHLRALPEPYVNLSIHTAPVVQPLPWHSDQWARSVGFARRNRSNQSLAPLV